MYDPQLGRFHSVDIIASEFPDLSPYQYAGNSPIRYKDLDGLEPADYYYANQTQAYIEAKRKRGEEPNPQVVAAMEKSDRAYAIGLTGLVTVGAGGYFAGPYLVNSIVTLWETSSPYLANAILKAYNAGVLTAEVLQKIYISNPDVYYYVISVINAFTPTGTNPQGVPPNVQIEVKLFKLLFDQIKEAIKDPPKRDPKPKPKPEPKPEPKPDPKPDPKPEPKPDPKPNPSPKTEGNPYNNFY
jgi:hypothetical protein